jgi:hypothetical protein
MFDISVLKEMKLPQLQEIAKLAKNIKYFNVKKDILIDLILDEQSKNNSNENPKEPEFRRIKNLYLRKKKLLLCFQNLLKLKLLK